MKKWVSNTINITLGVLIFLVVGAEVSMLVSQKSNHNVPSLFGYSFMSVLTDSMEGDLPDSLNVGTGVIIKKVSADEIKTDDVITFYSSELRAPVSHRVREMSLLPSSEGGAYEFYVSSMEQYCLLDPGVDSNWVDSVGEKLSFNSGETVYFRLKDDGTGAIGEQESYSFPVFSSTYAGQYVYFTTGDNGNSNSCNNGQCLQSYRDTVHEDALIGRVISHSDGFGSFLGVVQSSWFVPVAVLVPLAIIAGMSLYDYFKLSKKEAKEEEAEINKQMLEAGVDPKDEKAVILFTEKARYKMDIQKTMEKEKEKEKKRLEKEMKKK